MSQDTQLPLVFIGTYTHSNSDGIYVCQFDDETGELEPLSIISGAENPSFLAVHPTRRFLYATSEVGQFDGASQGGLYAYAIDAENGRLSLINSVGSGGPGPCHLTVDETGKYLLAANYHGGSVCVAPISDSGGLEALSCFIQHEGSSVNPERQGEAHAHSINLDSRNQYAFVPDLGQDRVVIYQLDLDAGVLTPGDPPHVEVEAGFGPRHFTFDPENRCAYLINELGSTITAFDYHHATGQLSEFQTVTTLPSGFSRSNTTADIHIHPTGRFIYGSNRGHNSVAVFSVDESSRRLTPTGHQSTHGHIPRNFAIDPSGRYLIAANQNSDTVVTFLIDAESGGLTPAGQVLDIPMPVCVRFLSD